MYLSGMRSILRPLLLLLAMPGAAAAQTPQEKAYVAARQQMVGELEGRRRSLPTPIDESAWHRE